MWRAPAGPEGLAAVPVGGGGARPRCWSAVAGPGRASDEANRPQHNRPHWCGGSRRDRRARIRCPWAVAGPGRASRRHKHRRCGGRRRDRRTWLRCPWAAAGPGRGAGRRRQGQGGPRDRPLRAIAKRVAISRAGRRRPAHTAARPIKAGHATVENQPGPPAPGTPVGPQAT